MTTPAVLSGAEPLSHVGTTDVGVLAVHGFTGNPSSMRGVAEAMVTLGHHVEMPLLPGHGTTIEDMVDTRWADWSAEVSAAHARLAARVDRIVVMGLSMGGTLTLWSAFNLAPVDGIVCINPVTFPASLGVVEMVEGLLEDGTLVAPGVGGDIADPEAVESAYDGSPLRPLLSMWGDGVAPMTARYSELTMPLLLITSRQDHVVEPANSEHLVANYGGPLDHVWLERSYHVATQDHDRDEINRRAGEFIARITGS